MATATVTADNVRIAEGTIANDTGTWGNDGGGGGIADEPDIVYQGSSAQSRKVSTNPIGRNYTHGSGTDMTATNRRHMMAKVQATNKNALLTRASPAMTLKQGSGSGAYYEHYIYGSDNYPKKGGFVILPISPNVSGYRDATSGSPTLTSVLYWSIVGDFSATAKAENLVIDAIDIGAGLFLVGGDGADPDADLDDLISFDEGTLGNSFGYVATDEFGKVATINGRIAIGRNSGGAVATVYTDSDRSIIWGNGLAESGFHELLIDLGNATTNVAMTRYTIESAGELNNTAGRGYSSTEDTRTLLTITGHPELYLL